MNECKNCAITDNIPDIKIDEQGICNLCHDYQPEDYASEEEARKEREADLEKALQECRGQAEYDCVVPLSGGKDSIYLLYKLKVEYGLKVLAFTTDVNIPQIAWNNIRTAFKKLDIDHVVYRPFESFYEKTFSYLLKNQEERGAVYTVSYVYAPLFEGDAIKLALEKNIPLVLAGYSPGQPEPERMMYEFSRKLVTSIDWVPPAMKESGHFTEDELSRFYNPLSYPKATEFPRYLAPYHAWEYNQGEVMDKVFTLELVQKPRYASPVFSNYPINWLLMYSDLKLLGYNPYLPEFSALVREGKANRKQVKMMMGLVDFMTLNKVFLGKEVKKSLEWLEMGEEDLCINLPKGAYDPPM